MNYRTLGRTGLRVSLASLGTGGPSRLGQQTHGDEAQMQRLVRRALELGINFIDTAAAYGESEAILGRALRGIPRDRYLIATKFSPYKGDGILSAADVAAACERSLQRLNLDTIDIYQFHSVVPESYREVVERLYPAAVRLREQGKVRFLGITEYFFPDPAHHMLEQALADDLWDAVMVKYGILNQSAAWRVLPRAQERNVGVINMSPVRVKMTRPAELEKVLRDWKARGLIDQDAVPDRGPLDFLLHGTVRSIVAAGYKFGAAHDAIATVLIGTGNIAHLEENVAALNGPPLPAEDMERLRRLFGHLAESEGDTG